MQDSYIGSTSASQAEEAGSITSILPPQDGRDAQHRSFWRSQKKMRRDTEAAQLPEYSRICRAEHGNENFICRIRTSVVHRLPKPRRRVRLPYPAPSERTPLFEQFCRKTEFFVSESLEKSALFLFDDFAYQHQNFQIAKLIFLRICVI